MSRALEMAGRAALAAVAEVERREAGEKPEPRLDALVDYLADVGEEIARWEWPGEVAFRERVG